MFYTDQYKPDFGLPYPTWLQDRAEVDRRLPTLEAAKDFLQKKLAWEAAAKQDPNAWGYRLPAWDEVTKHWSNYRNHIVLGGNRSGKSSFAAALCVDALIKIPEAKIRCFSINEERSIMEQQTMIWAALPDRFKNIGRKKGINHSIQYSQRNGFVGGKLILPPHPGYAKGSEILFQNYAQYKNDPQIAEGWFANAVWCDEEAPAELFNTLQFRLIDARGRLILTFTTLNGWSPLIADIMGRTKVLRRRHAPLLGREIPVEMDSLSRMSTKIHFFWTQDNHFIPSDDFLATLKGRPQEEILARAYGIPSKSNSSPFPGFDTTVHVLPHDRLPWLCPKTDDKGNTWRPPEVTHYMVIDPSGSKPWFIIWAAVDARGAIYIYHEFPDVAHGNWAESGKDAQGKAGPAQKQLAWGYNDYAEMLANVEGEVEIFERIIDPRLGAAQVQSKEGATSIISDFEDAMQEAGFKNATLIPAPGLNIEHGLSLINDRLNYDTTKPVGPLNAPKLFISERCENVIYAFKNFTNSGDRAEPTKDPIDCVRYLLEAGADFVPATGRRAGGRTFSY